MARQVVVLAFLLLVVVVVQAYAAAADSTPAPTASTGNTDADLAEPPTDGAIGVLEAADSPDSVVAAPMGGPVPPGAFDSTAGGSSSDASTLRFSAVAGAAALAGVIYF